MPIIDRTPQIETTVPVYRLLGRDYINKNDIINPALLVLEHTPNNQSIRVFGDTRGALFVTLYGIATSCGFSNWTNKSFTGAIRNLGVEVYRKVPGGGFMVRTSDVASIVEEILTAPFTEKYTQIDGVIISKPSKFLEWWNTTASAIIEKHTRKVRSLFDTTTEVTSDEDETTSQSIDTPIFDKFCTSGKSEEIVVELDLLTIQVNRLIAADLPHVLAVKTAINIRKKYTLIDDYAPIIEFIKRINPSIDI